MSLAVGTDFRQRTTYVNVAVAVDDEMITDLSETTRSVPAVDVGNRVVLIFFGSNLMNEATDLWDQPSR